MSEFKSMTVVVGKDVSHDGGHFHTITVDDTHDVSVFWDIIRRLDDAGYELMSVTVDGSDFTEEMVSYIDRLSNVPELFSAFLYDPHLADVICAFVIVNDCANVVNWTDWAYFYGSDHETVCREWADMFCKVYQRVPEERHPDSYAEAEVFPNWLSIDWKDTLSRIATENQSCVVEFAGMIYYFG